MLAVIDYGAGNLRSVLHALNHLGTDNMRIVQTPNELEGADNAFLCLSSRLQKLSPQFSKVYLRGHF